MRYSTPKEFLADKAKSLLVFGMSGVGKSYVSSVLSDTKRWHAHSIDVRIAELLEKQILGDYSTDDQESIRARINQGDISVLVEFLGKPGDTAKGGVLFRKYMERLKSHAAAEYLALVEAPRVFDDLKELHKNELSFICDTGGSICEVLDPLKDHLLLSAMSRRMQFVYIYADEEYDDVLLERFRRDPKPMYYAPDFLTEIWSNYTSELQVSGSKVDPDQFSVWGFSQLLKRRRPLYELFARRWGVKVLAHEVAEVRDEKDFIDLVASAIERPASASVYRKATFGKMYSERRKDLNVSRKSLAEQLGINEQLLTKLETNRVKPSEKLEKRLYDLLYYSPTQKKIRPKKGENKYNISNFAKYRSY